MELEDAANRELVDAAKSGDLARVQALLDAAIDPNQRNAEGDTALMYACAQAHPDVVRCLLDSGAEVNAPGPAQQYPLLRAVM